MSTNTDPHATLFQVAEDTFLVSVALTDAFFNRIYEGSGSVSSTLRKYPVGPVEAGLLSGCAAAPLINGAATFGDCAVRLQGFYQLELMATLNTTNQTMKNTTLVFDVQVAVKTIKFTVQPGASVAGQPLQGVTSAYPKLELLDQYNYRTISRRKVRLVLNSSNIVSNCAAECLNAAMCRDAKNSTCVTPARLMKGLEYEPIEGLATIDETVIQRASDLYRLVIVSSETLSVTSIPFRVTHGPTASIVVSRIPENVILTEPFQVQPLISLIDAYGNVASGDSTGTVHCTLSDINGFSLRGFQTARLYQGEARFENLAVDVESLGIASNMTLRLNFTSYSFSTRSIPFGITLPATQLQISSHPVNATAGQALGGVLGAPQVRLLDVEGQQVNLTGRAVAVRINDSACPDRYPAPRPAEPVLFQAQLQGVLPIVPGQRFVLNKFHPVGFGDVGQRMVLELVDGDVDCDVATDTIVQVKRLGAGAAEVYCDKTGCTHAVTQAKYVEFTILTLPASGTARVCVKPPTATVWRTLALTLQQVHA
jgi:hypothetical protein